MSSEMANCPHCKAWIAIASTYCPSCRRPIDKCRSCGFFLFPGVTNCSRCGAFVAKEPKIGASAWIEGGTMIGDLMKLKIHVENSGNIPTDIKITADCPENVKPAKIEDSFENLLPWAPIQRSYDLQVDAPGEYVIDKIEVTYFKSSKESDVVQVKPVNFLVHGRPKLQVDIEGDTKIPLGEEREYFINLKNTGTAAAHSARINISFPTSIHVRSEPLILPLLEPDDESTGILRLSSLFTGKHALKVKVVYSSPSMGHMAPLTFESAEKTLELSVDKRARSRV